MANPFARLTAISQDALRQLAERSGGGDSATRDAVWLKRKAYLPPMAVRLRKAVTNHCELKSHAFLLIADCCPLPMPRDRRTRSYPTRAVSSSS